MRIDIVSYARINGGYLFSADFIAVYIHDKDILDIIIFLL